MGEGGYQRRRRATFGKSGLLGFSATELIVTILIVMILAVLSAAGYQLYQRESPLKYAADRLVRAAATARSYAVANNAPYALEVHPNFNNFWIDEMDDFNPALVVTSKVVAPEALGQNISLVAVDWNGQTVTVVPPDAPIMFRFYPDGHGDDARLTLRLGEGAGARHAAVRIYGPTGLGRVMTDVNGPTQTLTIQ